MIQSAFKLNNLDNTRFFFPLTSVLHSSHNQHFLCGKKTILFRLWDSRNSVDVHIILSTLHSYTDIHTQTHTHKSIMQVNSLVILFYDNSLYSVVCLVWSSAILEMLANNKPTHIFSVFIFEVYTNANTDIFGGDSNYNFIFSIHSHLFHHQHHHHSDVNEWMLMSYS